MINKQLTIQTITNSITNPIIDNKSWELRNFPKYQSIVYRKHVRTIKEFLGVMWRARGRGRGLWGVRVEPLSEGCSKREHSSKSQIDRQNWDTLDPRCTETIHGDYDIRTSAYAGLLPYLPIRLIITYLHVLCFNLAVCLDGFSLIYFNFTQFSVLPNFSVINV